MISTVVALDQITTRWSQICDPLRFVMRYSQAIRAYLLALLRNTDAADEACQEFLANFLQGGLEQASPDRGRFRDYLKVSVRNTALALLRKKQMAPIDPEILDTMSSTQAEDTWLREWQRVVLDKAWRQLEAHEHAAPASLYFTVLHLSINHGAETSDQLASRAAQVVGRPVSAVAFRKQLSRARQQFAGFIIAEVAQTLTASRQHELASELADLGLLPYVREYLPPA